MWVISQDKLTIINAIRFWLSDNDDGTMGIVALYEKGAYCTVGKYPKQRALEVFDSIALFVGNESKFIMPTI